MVNSDERTWPVGRRRPNLFGLFDIVGGTEEWCQDAFQDYPADNERSPGHGAGGMRSLKDTERVVRGANYRTPARNCRSANRYGYSPATNWSTLGFRIVRTLPPSSDRN